MPSVRDLISRPRPTRAVETPHVSASSLHEVVVLCNAEPFGFGPAASLHAVMQHLHARLQSVPGMSLQYVGSGLTLALHKPRSADNPRGYDRVYDIDVYRDGGSAALTNLCKTVKPALFLTVCDATAASAALGAGTPVVVIDLLLWFWSKVPAPWYDAKQVLAADFHGVRERAQREALTNVKVMPPIAPPLANLSAVRHGVLLNMGGLRNPYTAASEHIDYARAINRATRQALALREVSAPCWPRLSAWSTALDVVAGPEIVAALGASQARTVSPAETQASLRACRLVCMTPGLGNLFEAAACAQHVLVLPPANDSQGQQMRYLKGAGFLNHVVDWHDIVDIAAIDYHKPQSRVLQEIQRAQHRLLKSRRAQGRLARRIYDAVTHSHAVGPSPLRGLIARYGNDGARVMAETVADTFQVLREVL